MYMCRQLRSLHNKEMLQITCVAYTWEIGVATPAILHTSGAVHLTAMFFKNAGSRGSAPDTQGLPCSRGARSLCIGGLSAPCTGSHCSWAPRCLQGCCLWMSNLQAIDVHDPLSWRDSQWVICSITCSGQQRFKSQIHPFLGRTTSLFGEIEPCRHCGFLCRRPQLCEMQCWACMTTR